MRCVIFAASRDSSVPTDFDFTNSLLICADGGISLAEKCGVTPDIVIGDFDSYKGKLPQDSEIVQLQPEKDDTDLEAAVNLALSRGCTDITILGALGGRADHLLGNFAVLLNIERQGATATIEDYNTAVFVKTKDKVISFDNCEGDTLSVVPFCCEQAVVTSSGVKYPLTHGVMHCDKTLGISNVITSNRATFAVEQGTVLFIKTKITD